MVRIKHGPWMVLLVLSFSTVARADFPLSVLDIVNPRPFGHVIGDVLRREITVQPPSHYEMDRASLPPAGPLDDWIEARPAVVEKSSMLGRVRYRITLTYQIMGSPESVISLSLPEVTLVFRRAQQQVTTTMPDWPVTLAPLAPENVPARAGLPEMRPDQPPSLIPTRPLEIRLGGYAALFALTLLYLGYRQFGWLNFAGAGPFARAYRDLKNIAKQNRDASGLQSAMRRVHRAFDETAGRTMFAGRLEEFFSSHARFSGVRDSIELFFDRSRHEFFGASTAGRMSIDDVIMLCRECYRCERHRP
jgi:mxaA protein